jgi:chromosome segregation ATPase
MNINWLIVGQVAAAVLGALGIGQIVQTLARRRTEKVDAVGRLNASTLEWAEQLKADAAEARTSAREARIEAAEARREAAEARRETGGCRTQVAEVRRILGELRVDAAEVASYLRQLINEIHDPKVTVDSLRSRIHSNPPPDPRRTMPS